jgi:hypothetical protein
MRLDLHPLEWQLASLHLYPQIAADLLQRQISAALCQTQSSLAPSLHCQMIMRSMAPGNVPEANFSLIPSGPVLDR